MRFLNSLQFKFILAVFIIVAVITVVLSVLSYVYEKRMLEDRVAAQLNSIADLKKELLTDYIDQRKNDLRLMSTSEGLRKRIAELADPSSGPAQRKAAAGFVLQRLKAFKEIRRGYRWLLVCDTGGNVLVNSESAPGHPSLLSPGQQELQPKVPRIAGKREAVALQGNGKKDRLTFARTMLDRGGKPLAVVASRVDLNLDFFPAFLENSGLGATGESLLVMRVDGRVAHLTPTRYPLPDGWGPGMAGNGHALFSDHVLSGKSGIGKGHDYRGKEIIGAYRYIPQLQWGIIAKIDLEEAFAEIGRLRTRRLLLSAAILGAALVIVYLAAKNFVAPVTKLIQNTRAIGAGRFMVLEKSGRKDEIGELEENFNEMVIALDAARTTADMKREDLENKVHERTEHLTRALEDLRKKTAEKKALQAQLLHSQKLEAVGTLAGGIAHDFNNLLTAITGYGNIIRGKLKDGDQLREYVEQILSASERAAGLTHGLLAFSRKQIIAPRPLNVNECIRRVEKLLARLIGEDIELKIEPCEQELIILADPGQIEQVLMNLATNARDAMPGGGCFSITTAPGEIDEEYISLHGYGEPGSYATISVSDTGAGMDEITRSRIFEPFFTTKETGKGTGLGLSIAYGIVKAQNGYITCYSEPGKGTTFKISMPLVQGDARTEYGAAARPVTGGKETVLVAEDNAIVRNLIRTVLSDYGYTVVEAENGVAAVQQYHEHGDTIDLLLLDVIMPRKNGKDVYDEICRIRPGIKVVFTSGYTDDIIRKQGLLDAGLAILPKPISPRDLLTKVRDVLDGVSPH